jgi:hypothetical protein
MTNRWSLSKPALKASSTSKRRSPIELAAALPVLLVPSGFVPGTGEDGRGLSSCFSGNCKGPDCFFQNLCKVFPEKVRDCVAIFLYWMSLMYLVLAPLIINGI